MGLVGREAWYASSVLQHGTVVEVYDEPQTAILLTDGGTRQAVHVASLLLTRGDVLREIDENIHYWNCKANEFDRGADAD